MKLSMLVAALALSSASLAHADSIWLTGAKADAVVNPLLQAGYDPLGPASHDYFQAGVVSCSQLFDDQGDYFPNGHVGDYVGEACLLYGDVEGSDMDGRAERQVLIPQDDQALTHSPEIKAALEKNRAIREGLETFVTPIVRTVEKDGHSIPLARTSGIGGIACEGRNKAGERVCQVLLSPKCPVKK